MSHAGAESSASSSNTAGPAASQVASESRTTPGPDARESSSTAAAQPHPIGRLINLRISTPSSLPAAVTSALGFQLPATTTVETVKRHIADRLQDALLFATGEPWTSTVYSTAIQNANEELLGEVHGDTIIRIIFQGRFLTDDMKLADVVRDINDVTFHMMLKQSIIDILTTAYKRPTIPSSTAPINSNLPPGVAAAVPQQEPASLFGTPTTAAQPIPALPSPPPPVGTNIVLYQDPRAATPLISPNSSLPVVTNSGHLAILISPQGISNFAAAGILIQEGNSAFVPGVQYSPDSSSFYRPVAAEGLDSSILAALLHAPVASVIHHQDQQHPQEQQQQQQQQEQRIHRQSLTERIRATLSDMRNNAHRLRNTLALTWLFLRLVFFVGLSSGEIGGSRFWTISAVAAVVFLWRANVLAMLGREIGRRVLQNDNNNDDNNNNDHQNHNNNNNNNNNAGDENQLANGQQIIRRRLGALGTIFLRPDEDETAGPENDNVWSRRWILREFERVVVVFLGTLVPAVYDAWHRHEVAREEARLQRQREREQEQERERERDQQEQDDTGHPAQHDWRDDNMDAAAAVDNRPVPANEQVNEQEGQDVDVDVEVLAVEGVEEQQLRHRNPHSHDL
ncbi:hypothetical protein V1509DRAFT_386538 [Lipomyces kononenkoae]